MSRLRFNNLSAKLGAPLSIGNTTITFQSVLTHDAGVAVPTIVAPDYIPLTLEPSTSNFEVVNLTAYTSGATTGTCSTVARTHGTAGVSIVHAPTVDDFAGGWEAITLSTAAGAWDVANAVGTWVFNGDGSISQTNPAAADETIATFADYPGTAFALRFDARQDADDGAGNAELGMFAAYPVVSNSTSATGLYVPHTTLNMIVYIGGSGPNSLAYARSVPIGEWHTYEVIVAETWGHVSLDGVPLGPSQSLLGISTPAATTESRIALYALAAATFRNLKAWRIPLPTLP